MSQYDNIGKRYGSMAELPAQQIEKPSILNVLGDVKGLRCLDLACGLGRWSHVLIEQGAAHVVGIDLSKGMIEAANEMLSCVGEEQAHRMEFHVGDCIKPLQVSSGPFDLVLAVWLLNYASGYDDMLAMWQNV